MFKFTFTLICVLLVISICDPITAAKLRSSGGGRHSYPSSRGHSGSHSSHSYPSGGGLSGGGHGYPSSGGLSGTGSRPQSHGYPNSAGSLSGSSGGHSYPSGGGLSGSGNKPATYPSGTGYKPAAYPSGTGYKPNAYPSGSTHTSHTTIHNHYNYNPPQQIRYVSSSGHAPASYPVYHGTPPNYVYQYKDSGSKYSTLLAGLALMNLGVLAGGIYASTHHGSSNTQYKAQPGEVCKFGLRKDNGDYEETRIDCQIITSFILQEQAASANKPASGNSTVTTTTMTNVTTVNTTNPAMAPVGTEVMLPNGTLVMVNNATEVMLPNGTLVMVNNAVPGDSSSTVIVTTTTTNTTTNAVDVKGSPVEVTPKMKCYVIRTTPTSNMRKTVECGLLQTYAVQSLKGSAVRNFPTFTILMAMVAAFVVY